MEYLVRLVHVHESFRLPELQALAKVAAVDMEIVRYDSNSPFCILRLPNDAGAETLISRAILSYAIYELWGEGKDYDQLHESVKANGSINPEKYRESSFRFSVDSFQEKRTPAAQRVLIESFSYLPFHGPIIMTNPDLEMCIFEDYERRHDSAPKAVYLGRLVAQSGRRAIEKYDLKKRSYISRTSMDAELSLVTANLTLSAPGKIIYDPFVGTGSFTVTAAHYGASVFGSDIDGRSIRGTKEKNLRSNFDQYGVVGCFLDSFISDLTHTPLRVARIFDGIICDPPYGVREGPKVLGNRYGKETQLVLIDGKPAHLQEGYIPPKRPYGFDDMLEDILEFSSAMLVDNGRLSMWMPTADDEDVSLAIPAHPSLELVSVSVQHFNKWSRRLLVYRRLPEDGVPHRSSLPRLREPVVGKTADDLNRFRRKYFQAFKPSSDEAA